jgi:type VII secretion-associated serine protease mycosin
VLAVIGVTVTLLTATAPAIASAATTAPPPDASSTPAAGSADTAPLPPATAAAEAETAYQDSTLVEGQTAPIVTVESAPTGPKIVSHDVRSSAQARAVATSAAAGNDLVAVEPDTVVRPTGGAPTSDQYAASQWALDPAKTTFSTAWKTTLGKNVKVAVVDTGVQATHPDLAGQVLAGKTFLKGTSITNKAALDPRTDSCGHGTHVAGTIAALRNNGIGVSGAAPGVKILPVKVLNCSGYASDVANGIKWAADNGAKVINLSLGGTTDDAGQDAAIAYARSKGAVVVAAAGNNWFDATCNPLGNNKTSYPGASPGVIGVAAIQSNYTRSCFSNIGAYVDLAAPGTNVLSTYPTNLTLTGFAPYASMSGTSMATPYVSAAAALVLSRWPHCKPDYVQKRLQNRARHLGSGTHNNSFGFGLVDPAKAVTGTTC